jgi:acyl transferase domain-containing protein
VTSHPLLSSVRREASAAVAVQAQLERPALGFLWDHTVQGRTILPGAAMCEMAVAAGKVRTLAAFPSVHHIQPG